MTDMYETRHDPEFYAAMQEAALDAWKIDCVWWIDRVMEQGITEIKEERNGR